MSARANPFLDRTDAGRRLGELVAALQLDRPIVLGLPRGGVAVAHEVARALGARMDVFVARKIGAPGHVEYGIGAIAEGGEVVADDDVLARLDISVGQFEAMVARERLELDRRVSTYRRGRDLPDLADRDVVVVDDGLATGVTAEAALRAIRGHRPRRLVLAVPVASPEAAERLRSLADEVVCELSPSDFSSVGRWYVDFDQTTDVEVQRLLDLSAGPGGDELE